MKKPLLLLWLLSGVSAPASEPAEPPTVNEKLRHIARTYLKGQLVNQTPQVAPTQCWRPPPRIRMSHAKGSDAHGGKLFYLFAKNAEALRQKEKYEQQAVGQYLVKETWAVVEWDPEKPVPQKRHPSGRSLSNTLGHEGKMLTTGDPLELYLMVKQKPGTPDTDEGWTYAVLSRDGSEVHRAGRIQSCIDCHEDAAHDRILGDYGRPLQQPVQQLRLVLPSK